jgi:hypothetical protein
MSNKKAAPGNPRNRLPTENSQSVTPSIHMKPLKSNLPSPAVLDAESADVLGNLRGMLE